MDLRKYEANWNEIKGRIKEKYSQLKDEDLSYAEGAFEDMIDSLGERLSQSREKIEGLISNVFDELNEIKGKVK